MDIEEQPGPRVASKNPRHDASSRDHMDRDAANLARMGKKQTLKRNFGLLTMLSFSCTILVTWEGVLVLFANGFVNGGPAALIPQFILVWGGTFSTFVSIGELASMAPTASGQYHWVYILAPRSARRFLSYITGWLTVLSWIATVASSVYLSASMIQALCLVNWDTYAATVQPYQLTLITWAVIIVCVFFNTVVASRLPRIEGGFLILHILGFFAILIPLLYYGPNGDAAEIFSLYLNEGHFPTYGLSFAVGTMGIAFAFVGADAAVHMCEEIVDAAVNVPRAIIASLLINGILGLGMLVAILFRMGDPDAALAAQQTIGYPFIEIFIQATGSKAGSSVMTAILIVLAISASVGIVATASRMIWSFARDSGLPFSNVFSRVHPLLGIPLWAVGLSGVAPCLLVLINIGSTVVFNDVVSLTLVALYSTYFICISLLLYRRVTGDIRRITPESEPSPIINSKDLAEAELCWGPWRVPGWLGIANNILSLSFILFIWVFGFFPPAVPVVASTMNYASLVFGAVVLYSIVYYLAWGHRYYTGPVVEISP